MEKNKKTKKQNTKKTTQKNNKKNHKNKKNNIKNINIIKTGEQLLLIFIILFPFTISIVINCIEYESCPSIGPVYEIYAKKGGLDLTPRENSLTPSFLLKCLYQDGKLGCHVFVC
jgi:hypothetical protein